MATTKKTTAEETTEATTKKDNRVEVYIPKGAANDDPNMFVGVNGVNYILPKGKKSMVPPHIKAEIDRSLAAQDTLDDRVDELRNKANQPLPGASV